jgi:hypothetical protein
MIDRAAAVAPPAVPAELVGRIRARLDAAAADVIPASTPVPQPAKLWRHWMPLAAAAGLCVAVLLWKAWPERLPYRVDQGQPVIAENAAPRQNLQAARAPSTSPAPVTPAPLAPPQSAQAAQGNPSDLKKESGARRQEEKRKVAADQPAGTGREEDLKSLGYVAAKPTEEADGYAAGDVAGQAPGAGVAPAARVAPAAGPTPFAGSAEPVAPSLLRHRVAPSLIRAEPYLFRLLEDRLVTIESGSYSCFVQVSEDDARQIATFIKEATNAAKSATAPGSQESFGAAIPSASPVARRVLLGMVRERYRSALEARCGPLPQ